MYATDQRYLESFIRHLTCLKALDPEVLDGHWASQVFSFAHVCEPTVTMNVPDVYGFLENV